MRLSNKVVSLVDSSGDNANVLLPAATTMGEAADDLVVVPLTIEADYNSGKSTLLRAVTSLSDSGLVDFASADSLEHVTRGIDAAIVVLCQTHMLFCDAMGYNHPGDDAAQDARVGRLALVNSAIHIAFMSAQINRTALDHLVANLSFLPNGTVDVVIVVRVSKSHPAEAYVRQLPNELHVIARSVQLFLVPEVGIGEPIEDAAYMDAVRGIAQYLGGLAASVGPERKVRVRDVLDSLPGNIEKINAETFELEPAFDAVMKARVAAFCMERSAEYQGRVAAEAANPTPESVTNVRQLAMDMIWRSYEETFGDVLKTRPAKGLTDTIARQATDDAAIRACASVERAMAEQAQRANTMLLDALARVRAITVQLTGQPSDVDGVVSAAVASELAGLSNALAPLRSIGSQEQQTAVEQIRAAGQERSETLHAQNETVFVTRRQGLAESAGRIITVPEELSGCLGAGGNGEGSHTRNIHAAAETLVPGMMRFFHSGKAMVTSYNEYPRDPRKKTFALAPLMEDYHDTKNGRKWFHCRSTYDQAAGNVTTVLSSGGWGKCSRGFHRRVAIGAEMQASQLLDAPLFHRTTYR